MAMFSKANICYRPDYEQLVSEQLEQLNLVEFCKGYSHSNGLTTVPMLKKVRRPDVAGESCLARILLALTLAQDKLGFVHNDLHRENIIYVPTKVKQRQYNVRGKHYTIDTHGVDPVIIDYELACIPGIIGPHPSMKYRYRVFYEFNSSIDALRICNDDPLYHKLTGYKYNRYNSSYSTFPVWDNECCDKVQFLDMSSVWPAYIMQEPASTNTTVYSRNYICSIFKEMDKSKGDSQRLAKLAQIIRPTLVAHLRRVEKRFTPLISVEPLDFMPVGICPDN